mgnify:CR=1 FL=1
MSERMLTVSDINVYYGAIHAIKNVSFEVNEGEVVALIGANGRQVHHAQDHVGPSAFSDWHDRVPRPKHHAYAGR